MERGFTLLEVLIAFLILSTTLAVAQAIFAQGLSRHQHGAARTLAVVHAQNLLEALGPQRHPGTQSGTFPDGSTWRLGIEEAAPGSVRLYRVEVTVTPPRGRPVVLHTLRTEAP